MIFLNIYNIHNTFITNLETVTLNEYKVTTNTDLNNKQGMFYPQAPLYYSAMVDQHIKELTLAQEKISRLTRCIRNMRLILHLPISTRQ